MVIGANTVVFGGKYSGILGVIQLNFRQIQWYLGGANTVVFEENTVLFGANTVLSGLWSVVSSHYYWPVSTVDEK